MLFIDNMETENNPKHIDIDKNGYEIPDIDGDRQRLEKLFYADPKNKNRILL